MNKIDITFDFTSDTPNYWDCFYAGVDRLDPDAKSPTMRQYQQLIYIKHWAELILQKLRIYSKQISDI